MEGKKVWVTDVTPNADDCIFAEKQKLVLLILKKLTSQVETPYCNCS